MKEQSKSESPLKRYHVCGVTCEPHLPECNNYCNMKTICGEKYVGPMPDSPAEIEVTNQVKIPFLMSFQINRADNPHQYKLVFAHSQSEAEQIIKTEYEVKKVGSAYETYHKVVNLTCHNL